MTPARRAALAGGLLLAGLAAAMPMPSLPVLAAALGGSPVWAGLVVAAYMIARTVAQPLAGLAADRWDPARVLVVGAWGFALTAAAAAGAAGVEALLGWRLLQGLGTGAVAAAARAALPAATGGRPGAAAGLLNALEAAGMLIGPMAGGLLADRWGAGAPFAVAAACAALAGACLLGAARGPAAAAAAGAAGGVTATAGPRDRAPRPAACRLPSPVAAASLPASQRRGLLGAALLYAGLAFPGGIYGSAWSLLLTRHGMDQAFIGLTFAVYSLPIVLLGPVAGRVCDRVGPLGPALAGTAGSAAMAVSYALLPRPLPILVFCVVDGVCNAFALSAALAMLLQAVPPSWRGRAAGLAGGLASLAALAGSLLGGAGFARDPRLPFALAAALMAATALAAVALQARGRAAAARPPLAGAPAGEA